MTRRVPGAVAVTASELPLGEAVCLALVDGGLDHGWAIGSELAPGASLGRVWSLSRALTYRAIEQLVTKGLLVRRGTAEGRARERSILACTATGRKVARAWLDTPVAHVRDVRTELLLKLILRERHGIPTRPLLEAQRSVFESHLQTLTSARADGDVVSLWRRESARATRRFLDAALDSDDGVPAEPRPGRLRISARNQLHGRIAAIGHGDVLSTVSVVLPDGQSVTAVITRESINDLDLAPDDPVVAVIKSTEVMLAAPPPAPEA